MIFVQASRLNGANVTETNCDTSLYPSKFKHRCIGFILTYMK